ncbi:alpha/beta fold hydrolase [Hymenobacter psychrotolerans]|uniref:Pimeloyl-ACP methyl ester carboxylesterase n=1 Tax=Hymenobacter psychrotolerans DSM 18569 TaxID=1121959 RepID=A0A1M7FM78_9BACT|nr:alpha/beta hydrolase [Hymenobacter psychrotolerans]SHM05085.1 Pimeloyl-ACP methyl ester carboxylesterase [Hymenobacter psychrotolerans DSM 18569]
MKHTILLLHGALASEAQLKWLKRELPPFYAVHSFSFSGHGGRPLVAAEQTMKHFAQEVQQFIRSRQLPPVHVFGYSMGGYAALAAAVSAPELFGSITTLGTKFDWSPATAALETRFLDAEKMREKVPQFVEHLEQLHAPTPLPELLAATASLMRGLGDVPLLTPQNLATLEVPVQVLVGELDKTAGVDASRHFADFMPRATFEIIMNTPHPLEKVNPDLLVTRIARFVEQVQENRV